MKSRYLIVLMAAFSIHHTSYASVVLEKKDMEALLIKPAVPAVPAVPVAPAAPTPHLEVPVAVNPSQERIKEILDFWFGALSNQAYYPEAKAHLWLDNSSDFDQQNETRFEDDVHKALSGQLNDWRQTPKGRLVLVLLLDQFLRRMYPEKPQAYVAEAMARGLVLEGIQKGDDRKLFPIERAFFYMPLQRSEDLNLQNKSVRLYTRLLQDTPDSLKPHIKTFLDDALLSQEIIARFNRFPSRNKVLGRESTVEETMFLNQINILNK